MNRAQRREFCTDKEANLLMAMISERHGVDIRQLKACWAMTGRADRTEVKQNMRDFLAEMEATEDKDNG